MNRLFLLATLLLLPIRGANATDLVPGEVSCFVR